MPPPMESPNDLQTVRESCCNAVVFIPNSEVGQALAALGTDKVPPRPSPPFHGREGVKAATPRRCIPVLTSESSLTPFTRQTRQARLCRANHDPRPSPSPRESVSKRAVAQGIRVNSDRADFCPSTTCSRRQLGDNQTSGVGESGNQPQTLKCQASFWRKSLFMSRLQTWKGVDFGIETRK